MLKVAKPPGSLEGGGVMLEKVTSRRQQALCVVLCAWSARAPSMPFGFANYLLCLSSGMNVSHRQFVLVAMPAR
jgi:hypothetical protein